MNIILFDNLEAKNTISVFSREGCHITQTLHLKENDEFKAGIWGVSKGKAVIKNISKTEIVFSYTPTNSPLPPLPLVLIIAQIRPICMKRVLRYVGEVGLKGIILTPCSLTEKSYTQSTLYKEENIYELIKEGVEISGDVHKPSVYYAKSVQDAICIAENLGAKNKYLLHISQNSQKLAKENDFLSTIAIGPERGWSEEEVKEFIKNGFLIYNIGNRIIRSEESAIISCYPWL